jgi:glucose-6-phosphate isomerase
MALPKINPTTTKAWQALQAHFEEAKNLQLLDLFAEDANRGIDFSISWNDFFVDVSKNRITAKTRELLLQLAEEVQLKEAIKAQFSGEKINETEDRAVLHTALRDFSAMKPEVTETLEKMKSFSDNVSSGSWKGYTGKAIKTIVNIGIGGSDLGPDMVCEALGYYRNHLEVRFVSNVDGDHVAEKLKNLNPETTLFIVVSKTFTTQETRANANAIKKWFLTNAPEEAIKQHFVAVSTNIEAVRNFGISEDAIFPMWDWVGGRFSLWSSVGLTICCAIGYTHFENLLRGANEMDQHFVNAPFSENIPVALALISVWYNNFFSCETQAVIPYCQALHKLVPYLQQAIMESNGKSIDRNGEELNYETGAIIWGATGTNAQHAFFQLLHQGTKLIPAEFICFTSQLAEYPDHHSLLLANCLAQTESLATGKQSDPAYPHATFIGNKPSTSIYIKKLSPRNLGSLLAMYEHKIFVQGVVWNIFNYDQWGVQLGKEVATGILQDATLLNNETSSQFISKLRF